MIVYNFDSKIVNTPEEIIKNAKENDSIIMGDGIKKVIINKIFEVENYKLQLGDLIEQFYYQKINKIFEWIMSAYNKNLKKKMKKNYEIKKVFIEHKYFILNNNDLMYMNFHQDNYTITNTKVWTINFYGEINNIDGGKIVLKNKEIIPRSNMIVLIEEGEVHSILPFMTKNKEEIGIRELISFFFLIE
jgi:CRISPR/Cas system-associated exonuclease Cas4 (RecB family)